MTSAYTSETYLCFYAFSSGSTCNASLNTLLTIMKIPIVVATTSVSPENVERS